MMSIRAYITGKRRLIGTVLIFILLIFLYLWNDIVITVPAGHHGVKYSRFFGGTVIDSIYPEGVYCLFPWDVLTIYDTRIQEETQTVEVLTSDGLTVNLTVSLRYQLRFNRLPELHKLIGPDFKEKILLPLIVSTTRQIIGRYKTDMLYAPLSQEIENILLVAATKELGRLPILLQAFMVKQISLPQELKKSIEDKLVAEQQVQRYQSLLKITREEAKRKALEAEGVHYYQQRVNENMTDNYLRYEGIKATQQLAESDNAKIVIMGGKDGLPVMLNIDNPAPKNTAPGSPAPEAASRKGQSAGPSPASAPEKEELATTDPSELLKNMQKPLKTFMEFLKRLDEELLKPEGSKEVEERK